MEISFHQASGGVLWKSVLKYFKNSQEKSLRPATLSKKTLAQVFAGEFCEVFNNIFFTGHLQTTASQVGGLVTKTISVFDL